MLNIGNSVSTKSRINFNPLRIKGCRMWYDFMDPTFIFSDAGVTNVNNNDSIYRIHNKAFFCQESSVALKALGSYIEQGSASKRPVWKKGIGADFNNAGGAAYLFGNSGAGGVSGSGGSGVFSNLEMKNSNFTMFLVLASDTANFASADIVFQLSGPDSNDLIQFVLKGNAPNQFIINLNSGGGLGPKITNNIATGVSMPAETALFTINCTGALGNLFYGNGRSASGSSSVTATTAVRDFSSALSTMVLGNASDSTTSFLHDYKEVIIYSSALSRDDAYEVEKYLMHKHGISIHNSRT